MALMGLFNVNDVLEGEIGSYYTKLLNPISIRFSEYPSDITNPYYSESSFTAYKMVTDDFIKEITAYCCTGEDSLEYKVLNRYKDILSEKGIKADGLLLDLGDIIKLEAAVFKVA